MLYNLYGKKLGTKLQATVLYGTILLFKEFTKIYTENKMTTKVLSVGGSIIAPDNQMKIFFLNSAA